MVNQARKITWSARALKQFNSAISYIHKDSGKNAGNVAQYILSQVDQLADNTVSHRIDPYKRNNDGNYRYTIAVDFRISYYESEDEIYILRFRHERMKPKNY